jgi:hypothetical protein
MSLFKGNQGASELQWGEVVLDLFDQRMSRERFQFSQEWHASTTQRLAFQPGI